MRGYAFFLAALALEFTTAAAAAGSIATVYVATKAPTAGRPISVEIGVTTGDPGGWAAGDYGVTLRLRSSQGSQSSIVGESAPVTGTQAVSSGKIAVIFAEWTLPKELSGYYQLEVVLQHAGAVVDTSPQWTLKVSPQGSTQTVAPAATPQPSCFHGSSQDTAHFGQPPVSQTELLSFNGCLGGALRSYTLSGGLSSAPGAVAPVLEIDGAHSRLQAGILSLQFDPLSIDGVQGRGVIFQQNSGQQPSLQLAWLREQGSTTSITAAQYTIRSPSMQTSFAVGHERIDSPLDQGGLSNWDNGNFATLSLLWQAPGARSSYGMRFGLVNYLDADGQTSRSDRAFEAFATVAIGASTWTIDELRTGPFYLAPGAPGIIADRDAQKISGSFPLGRITATLSAEGYRDDLPGANLPDKTNNWTESALFTVPIRNDEMDVTFTNAVQQQSGVDESTSGSQGVSAVYTLRRGPQNVQFSYGVTGIRSSPNQMQTQVQSGIQVSRTIAQGLSLTIGTNLAGIRAPTPDGVSFTHTNFATLSFSHEPWTLSSSVSQTAMQPGAGIAPPQNVALNAGLELKLAEHTALKLAITKLNGSASSSTGSIDLATRF